MAVNNYIDDNDECMQFFETSALFLCIAKTSRVMFSMQQNKRRAAIIVFLIEMETKQSFMLMRDFSYVRFLFHNGYNIKIFMYY